MKLRHLAVPLSFIALAVLIAGPAGAFRPDATNHNLEFRLESETVSPVYKTEAVSDIGSLRSSGLDASWRIQRNERTGVVHAAYGAGLQVTSAVASEAEAADLAKTLLLTHSDILGTRQDNMELINVRHALGKYAVHYRQVIGGTPVRRATAWVLMDEQGNVAGFGSDFYPDHSEIPTHATLSFSDAVQAAANSLGTTPQSDRPVDARAILVPAASGELMELTAAYEVVFETTEPFGKWETIVHGLTGEILARRNLLVPINVTGTVQGDAQNQPPSHSLCDASVVEGFAHLTVDVQGGNSADTDASGYVDIPHGGSSSVTVDAELNGPYININRYTGLGADANESVSATPGTPFTLNFNSGNSRQDERDCWVHGNRVRDFMFGIDPTFTNLDLPVITWVGRTDGFCPGNAWWNIGGGNMNFCEAGGGYNNTGELGNVVYHEYGHGVTEKVYSRNGQGYPVTDLGEGNSDVVANFLDRNSIIGIGFFQGNCVSGIRDADNSLRWPGDNDGGHYGGQIIAGFHWDAWQSMLGVMPQALADSIAAATWHYGRDMGTPSSQPDQVLWTFMADDNDADLTNGTPNYDHFCLGATNHGFSCPTILTGVVISHIELGNTTDNVSGYDVVATITSTAAALDPAKLKVLYSVNGGTDVELLMSATANPDEYSVKIPAQNQHSEVEYYISAEDMVGNSRTHPALAPSVRHAFDVALVYDGLEGATGGWTTIDAASTGEWEVADPIGTQAQPEDDSTPGVGTQAWITGQCSGANCSGGCTLGCNDIDGGTVTLLTPVYDLTGATQAMIKYDRWYSNNTGAEPSADDWIVEISNDGGSNWSTVENTQASNASWTTYSVDIDATFGTPGMVQLRFLASDLAGGSLVEAAVDEIRVLATFNGAVDVTEMPRTEPLAFSLEQNQPNPFRPETRIRYALPQRADVRLTIYDVQGRTVRDLANGVREAGRYTVDWNGRDTQGDRVAAGVYFYRLTAGERTLTRKMTVLK